MTISLAFLNLELNINMSSFAGSKGGIWDDETKTVLRKLREPGPDEKEFKDIVATLKENASYQTGKKDYIQ